MANSTLEDLRAKLENQIEIEPTDVNTNPTSTLLNLYINESIRKIARRDKPTELQQPSLVSANLIAGTNQVSLPVTIFNQAFVYIQISSGKFKKLTPKSIDKLIELEGPELFFDSNNVGDADYFAIQGSKIILNKYLRESVTNGLKVIGGYIPSGLVNDSDECSLFPDWDMLIVYQSAVLFYQRDDDLVNQQKYEKLAREERAELNLSLDDNLSETIDMDETIFHSEHRSIREPGVMFGG